MTAAVAPAASVPGRRFAPVTGPDWSRCRRHGTLLDPTTGDVVLAGQPTGPTGTWPSPPPAAAERGGLTFDPRGCLYHGVPERGQLQRIPWPGTGPGGTAGPPVDLLADPEPEPVAAGGFAAVAAGPGRPLRARALAADADEHLFVLDGGTGTVAVLDLTDGRLLRTVALPHRPVDLAARGAGVLVALASCELPLAELTAIGRPRAFPAGAALDEVPRAARPHRVAVGPDGAVWLLLRAGAAAWIVRVTGGPVPPIAVPGADDLAVDGTGRLVVAGPADSDLLVWTVSGEEAVAGPPLQARDYDGRGIAVTPAGRIGFWTGRGFRTSRPYRLRYPAEGSVETYRLDSGTFGRRWGRLFVEACVPPGTRLEARFATADDPPEDGSAPPASRPSPLHRRETGRELPWTPLRRDDRFEVYECPVQAPPGRYLWLRLRLGGTPTQTPRVRSVRVEAAGHDLLEQLPRAYRRDPVAASFLHRYLSLVDGVLGEMEARAVSRELLLDPRSAPVELLPWLASLIGLRLDERWPEAARRTLLAEAGALFRQRGTVPGLTRLLQIYLRCPVVILESFRLRGPGGGAEVGGATGPAAVVGSSFRVGGDVRTEGGEASADGFGTHAHRFSVLIARDLDADEQAVVRDLLEAHRPAHTVVEVCGAGRGMRVGIGLHLAVSTIVGPSSGFARSVVGRPLAGTVLGRPRAGVRAGSTRLLDGTVVES